MDLLAKPGKEASSPLRAGQGPGAPRRPAELEPTHLCLPQTLRGNMERHNVLILSNLDTVEHLEIWIWLISDMETDGTLLRLKNKG
ncbi:hypothetical protein PBY51_014991 [Eleginops maclovinus]|uniref:Uncharacterized protein n=1 Tax=Eleginops maclovinus TaxID=56733 RepID=A0AAN7X6L3_ELEMC|nr:hypothetical protein PBY51_014991 [Eleginops maclovinus]